MIRSMINPMSRKISSLVALCMPAGFEWFTDTYKLYSNNTTDFDVTAFRNNTGKTYYVKVDGSDANDGLTVGTAFATVEKARTFADADIIEW